MCFITLIATVFVGFNLTRPSPVLDEKVYVLKRGQNATDFAEMLEREGVLSSKFFFILTARWGQFERKLKAGEYKIPPGASILEILDILVVGDAVEYPITFIEGWTFQQMLQEIWSKKNIEATLVNLSDKAILEQINIPADHPEGWFFPDTYHYNLGETDASILLKSYTRMLEILNEEWSNRDPNILYSIPYEGLIVASIIQKESYLHKEFPVISGVIVNRLKKRMRLQMDPTVIYGMGQDFNGNLLRKHLKTDHEYNTYTRHGLPPTPIAMPGRAAIHAALHPAETKALYFVARGDGSHQFSETLRAHNKAVRQLKNYKKKN